MLLPLSVTLHLLGREKNELSFLWTEVIRDPIGARWREALRSAPLLCLSVLIRLGWTPSGLELNCLLLGPTEDGTPMTPLTRLISVNDVDRRGLVPTRWTWLGR